MSIKLKVNADSVFGTNNVKTDVTLRIQSTITAITNTIITCNKATIVTIYRIGGGLILVDAPLFFNYLCYVNIILSYT